MRSPSVQQVEGNLEAPHRVAAPRSPTPRQRASHKDFTGKPCLDISPPRFCLTDPRKRGRMVPLIVFFTDDGLDRRVEQFKFPDQDYIYLTQDGSSLRRTFKANPPTRRSNTSHANEKVSLSLCTVDEKNTTTVLTAHITPEISKAITNSLHKHYHRNKPHEYYYLC
jgi:hypothetical protein